jgi:hypothetical protein
MGKNERVPTDHSIFDRLADFAQRHRHPYPDDVAITVVEEELQHTCGDSLTDLDEKRLWRRLRWRIRDAWRTRSHDRTVPFTEAEDYCIANLKFQNRDTDELTGNKGDRTSCSIDNNRNHAHVRACLSASQYDIVCRKHIQGQSLPEIAEMLGLHKDAVRSRYFRAMKLARACADILWSRS